MQPSSNNYTPIVIFTYKRINTLKQLITELVKCELAEDSFVYIYSDGPKTDNDIADVKKVRDYISTIKGFKKLELFYSETNKGLAKSIITGVSAIFEEYDKIIVLEDDLIPTPNFLTFMNLTLTHYEKYKNVFSVSAYSFNLKRPENYEADIYFLNRGWSWGWGTWKDRWENIDWDVKDYKSFNNNAKLKHEFNNGGSDLSGMLEKQMTGKVDSWAIRWFYHQFKQKGLTIYPVYSKILNIGFDKYATHTKGSDKRYVPKIVDTDKSDFRYPDKIGIDIRYQKAFRQKMGILSRIRSRLLTMIMHYIKLIMLK